MIYSVNYMDMTLQLNPLAVARYLADTGWELYPVKRSDIRIFQYKRNDLFEQVTIPLKKQLRDYKIVMHDAICKIASVETKSVEQIMLYLLNPNTDILKIRINKQEVETGNILFDDAIQLYDNAKKLLAATALDVINPQKVHYGRNDESVQKFLSQCRFGQTEIGSYVVSVVCPFAELSETNGYRQLSIFSDEEQCANSLTRKVTNRLMTNVATIKQEIDNGNLDALADYDNPISANFFEALNGISMNSENTTVEFMAEWAPTVKRNRCEYNRISVTNDYCEPMQTIISRIKTYTNERTEIIGRIKELKAAPILDKRESGTIIVAYIGDTGRAKTVTVKLDREDYDKAVAAHQHGKAIKVIGDLKSRTKAVMEKVIFSVIE